MKLLEQMFSIFRDIPKWLQTLQSVSCTDLRNAKTISLNSTFVFFEYKSIPLEVFMIKVEDMMTLNPHTLSQTHTLHDAKDMMDTLDIRHIPIIDNHHHLQGLIT